jgi:hypothetical protein
MMQGVMSRPYRLGPGLEIPTGPKTICTTGRYAGNLTLAVDRVA